MHQAHKCLLPILLPLSPSPLPPSSPSPHPPVCARICLMLSFECFSVLIGMLIFSSLFLVVFIYSVVSSVCSSHVDTIPQNACLLSKQIYRHLLICCFSLWSLLPSTADLFSEVMLAWLFLVEGSSVNLKVRDAEINHHDQKKGKENQRIHLVAYYFSK